MSFQLIHPIDFVRSVRLHDLDFNRRVLHVVRGKGCKYRFQFIACPAGMTKPKVVLPAVFILF